MIAPKTGSIGNTIAYHSEAPYALRRNLIEKAKDKIKELASAEVNALLSHSFQRSKTLEDRLEDKLIKEFGFGRGCMHEDANSKIVFKTFL